MDMSTEWLLLLVVCFQKLLKHPGLLRRYDIHCVPALEILLLGLDFQNLGVEVRGHFDLQRAHLIAVSNYLKVALEVVECTLRSVVGTKFSKSATSSRAGS